MSELVSFPDGGFAFLAGGFPYSQGVRALDGYAIERARFVEPLPVQRGFTAIGAYLASIGRPRTALCVAELRSPKPFSMGDFKEFNQGYVAVLKEWGLFRDERNPVARSNVAPEQDPPDEACFYAFCYTVPAVASAPSFVVAGSGEWPEGGKFPDDIVARGDVSPSGLQAKARFVMGKMESRIAGLGASWREVTATQVYTVHDIHTVLREDIVPRAGNGGGLTWHLCRPPIEGLEYEMDVRGVAVERVLDR